MKTCFKCGVSKSLADFYKHPRMADGHLGKCKECSKADTAVRFAQKMATDPIFQIVEGARQRAKSEKQRREGKAARAKPETTRGWRKRNPEKVRCHSAVARALRKGTLEKQPCEECGKTAVHAHHDDYTKPLEVRWLCAKHHGETHATI